MLPRKVQARSGKLIMKEATWIWWSVMMIIVVMVMPSSSYSSSTIEEADLITKNLGYSKLTFTVEKEGYSDFITKFRNQVAALAKTCDIQTTPSKPATSAEYVLVELTTADKTKVVTLGIDVRDLYILGYEDTYNGKKRVNMLKGVPDTVTNKLFPGAVKRVKPFPFTGGYPDLEKYSPRAKIELKFSSLDGDIKAVSGKDADVKISAKFFLRVIQFVSEAARFKFIANTLQSQEITDDFRKKLVAYEQVWDKISQSVHSAASKTSCNGFTPFTVNGKQLANVKDLEDDVALIKHKKTSAATNSILADTDDDAAHQEL